MPCATKKDKKGKSYVNCWNESKGGGGKKQSTTLYGAISGGRTLVGAEGNGDSMAQLRATGPRADGPISLSDFQAAVTGMRGLPKGSPGYGKQGATSVGSVKKTESPKEKRLRVIDKTIAQFD